MDKIVKVVIGLAIAYVVSEVSAEVLEAVGVPKKAAVAAGGIIGGLI